MEHGPRPVSYNCSAESRADHHGNIATEDMMTAQEAEVVTGIFKNRECSIGRLGCDCAATLTEPTDGRPLLRTGWRALMSVDDVIAGVIGACEELGVADNTYFFYSVRVHLLSSPGLDSIF